MFTSTEQRRRFNRGAGQRSSQPAGPTAYLAAATVRRAQDGFWRPGHRGTCGSSSPEPIQITHSTRFHPTRYKLGTTDGIRFYANINSSEVVDVRKASDLSLSVAMAPCSITAYVNHSPKQALCAFEVLCGPRSYMPIVLLNSQLSRDC